MPAPRSLRLSRPLLLHPLGLALAVVAALAFGACDSTGPTGPPGSEPLDPIASDHAALVAAAFEDVESLFDLGWRTSAGRRGPHPAPSAALDPARARVDTTTYTGLYDAVNAKGYLVQLQYRTPQGVGVWQARVQHARAVDHDGDGGTATADLDAVETVTVSFLTFDDLAGFIADVEAGAVPYLTGASTDAQASFAAYDTWRVAQLYSPGAGEAVVSYANADLRESVAVREPVVTQNADGTGTVRDGGAAGSVRTRYYGADFTVDVEGNVSGTLLRTLTSYGDTADGAVVSRNDYADGTYRQTRQRGGDGVVVRENSQG